MTEPEIDTAIDRAVRDLMNVDADAAFRARVADRLKRPAARRTRSWLLAVPAAAVIVVIALAWMRSSPDVPAGPAPLARVEAPAPAMARTEAVPAAPQPLSQPTQQSRRVAAVRNPTASIPSGLLAAAVEMPGTPIAPLTPVEAITVDPIVSASIVSPEIVVAPLSPMAELEISTLDPRSARD